MLFAGALRAVNLRVICECITYLNEIIVFLYERIVSLCEGSCADAMTNGHRVTVSGKSWGSHVMCENKGLGRRCSNVDFHNWITHEISTVM
jgi:hypothetical protein